MPGKTLGALVLAVWLLLAGAAQAASAVVETRDLLVSDATGNVSEARLADLAGQAQAMLERVLTFWSADSGVGRFGKIRVIFDVPRRGNYSCVFYWAGRGPERVRNVRVFGFEGPVQMLAHKLTSAVFPQQDKLIRNMMGILTEEQLGNPLTFPRCGFGSDDWVLALLKARAYIPLDELGPDHESWGMKDAGGGRLMVLDRPKQHRSYAEAGSFGGYLFQTYGPGKILRLQRLSHEIKRPWQDVFGLGLEELEANWLSTLKAQAQAREAEISVVSRFLDADPVTACTQAQRLASGKR
ncbi:MAG: hypothetical protein CVU73_10645 [Deltaproteobacteria bacterium HGW-Deltaproteobacteria-8]|jgi:hypothetical protein|nr:MAG: hypothetical protein CVU73_10645 [Deltaproteobacteria bacterium HGW-Deltaproteobacteria-8]